MFKNYWKMSDGEIIQLASKYHIEGQYTQNPATKISAGTDISYPIGDTTWELNRKEIIDQLTQKDNRDYLLVCTLASVAAIILSIIALLN